MRKLFKPELLFLAISLLLGYVSYWTPSYLNLFFNGGIRILGNLSEFNTECKEQDAQSICSNRYVIPKELLNGVGGDTTIGFGHILVKAKYGCFDHQEFRPIYQIGDFGMPGARQDALHAYRTVPIELFSGCKEAIAVESWIPKGDIRKGYFGGLVTVGRSDQIELERKFIEYISNLIPQALALAGLAFYFFIIQFLKFFDLKPSRNVTFFNLIPIWLLTFLLTTGVFQTFIPFTTEGHIVVRLGYFFSLLSFSFTGALYVSKSYPDSRLVKLVRWASSPMPSISRLGVFSILVSPFALLMFAFEMSPFYAKAFGFTNLLLSSVFFLLSFRSLPFFCFSLVYLASVAKTFNHHYFPQSNTAFFFVGLSFIWEIYAIIRSEVHGFTSAAVYSATDDKRLAAQVVHDIRSPIGVLKMLISQVRWPDEETDIKEAVLSALARVSDLSRNALNSSKKSLVSERMSIEAMIKEVIRERQIRFPKITVNQYIEVLGELNVRFPENDLYRVVSNSLENAFQAESVTTISVSVERQNAYIVIRIENDGATIPQNVLKEILRSGGSFNKASGTGLGVRYCKETVERYGGTYLFTSTGSNVVLIKILLAEQKP